MSGVKLFRLVAWVAVAAVGGLFIGLSVSKPWQQQNAAVASSTGIAAIGGPFQLTSHQGGTIDNAALAGKPYLAFFGFTHCPRCVSDDALRTQRSHERARAGGRPVQRTVLHRRSRTRQPRAAGSIHDSL
nr:MULTISPECIES: SCO family protein [Thalassobaculum]